MMVFQSGGRRASLVTAARRHALEFMDAETVADGPAPDLFFVSAIKRSVLKEIAHLPPQMLAAVRSGQTRMVLDSSGEGIACTRAWVSKLHRALDAVSIPTDRVVYLTQDRVFETRYRRWAAETGASPMTIIVHDYYIRALFHPFSQDGEAEYERRLADYRARHERRSKRFVCLNFSPRVGKVLLLLRLIDDGLWEQGHISFSGFDRAVNDRAAPREKFEAELTAFPGFEDMAADMLSHMDALAAKGSLILGPVRRSAGVPNHFKNLAVDMPLAEYGDAWFTVVTETEMDGHRLTEKPFKAMLNFSPTLILGNRRTLPLVRELGFQTFGGLIDEAYDAEPTPRARFERVYGELRRLCALPEAELARLEAGIGEVLEHNARWGLTRMPGRYEAIDARLAARLLENP